LKRRKRKGAPGDIVRIDIGDGRHTYGLLLTDPYVAVYDLLTGDDESDLTQLPDRPVMFIVAVYDRAIDRDWPIVGQMPAGSTLPAVPERFMQDMFNPQSCQIIDVDGNIRPATPQECVGLERAAVWEAEHVAKRIRDHYAGRPNLSLEHMKLKL
jgi:hypothetical protein